MHWGGVVRALCVRSLGLSTFRPLVLVLVRTPFALAARFLLVPASATRSHVGEDLAVGFCSAIAVAACLLVSPVAACLFVKIGGGSHSELPSDVSVDLEVSNSASIASIRGVDGL